MLISQKERAYSHIRDKLLLGGLQAGARLSEVTLAKEIGISRTPVREAMNQLESEGLIEQIPRFGTFVRKLERRELEELYDLRAVLEGYAAARAALRVTPEQVHELHQLCDHMRDLVREYRAGGRPEMSPELSQQWVMADVALHMLILNASGSERVAKIASDSRILTHICGHNRQDPKESVLDGMGRTWREHKEIVRALERRQSDRADELIEAHIQRAKESALANFDRSVSPPDDDPARADWPASVRRVISEMESQQRRPRR
jgi:DNA-binding GntR family transcriptional regulator